MYRVIAFLLVLIIAANISASSGLVHFIKHEKISKLEAEQSQKQSDSQLLKKTEGEASLKDEIAAAVFNSIISLFLIPGFVEQNKTVLSVHSKHPFTLRAPLFLCYSVFRI